ncbi:unnamed protein product [Blepharisma stoltei]|uniref:Uncharacterized protein n=1 Tax=Blepharisma stoltei TaxID=1481888 RepID=A0AAU9J8S3_9CILI|nr:unnamed protein product [Blepharisma stoltei]
MNFKGNVIKVLSSYENCAYLIDFSGKVFQSEINNPFSWNIVENWNSKDLIMTYGQRAFYKDCWYFLTAFIQIFKFDLRKKEIKEVHSKA